jgi:hypothetical protein
MMNIEQKPRQGQKERCNCYFLFEGHVLWFKYSAFPNWDWLLPNSKNLESEYSIFKNPDLDYETF